MYLRLREENPVHLGEGGAQVGGEPVDHLGAPALGGLALQDVAPDLPVEEHQFAVDSQRGALLGRVDAAPLRSDSHSA